MATKKSALSWSPNVGRPRTKKPEPDTLIRLLEPCSFGGVSREPGDEILLRRSEAAGLIACRRAQLASDTPPHDLALRRSKPSHLAVRYIVSCALPGNHYVVRQAGETEHVSEQKARELVAGGFAEIAPEAPAQKKR